MDENRGEVSLDFVTSNSSVVTNWNLMQWQFRFKASSGLEKKSQTLVRPSHFI